MRAARQGPEGGQAFADGEGSGGEAAAAKLSIRPWIRPASFSLEGLRSHIQIHRITCETIVNQACVSGNVCMQEFKAPAVVQIPHTV